MLQRVSIDLDWIRSPFFSPRAMLWNIKTLGLSWWLRCLTQNMRSAFIEHYRALGIAGSLSNASRAR